MSTLFKHNSDYGLAFFLYPLLPLKTASEAILHNVVMQIFTAAFLVTTIYMSQDSPHLLLRTSKIITIFLAICAALYTTSIMVQGSGAIEKHKKTVSTFSIIVGILAVLIGTISVLYYEYGTMFWLDLFVTITNIFWVFRSSELR